MQTNLNKYRKEDKDPHYIYHEGDISSEYYLHKDIRRWKEKGQATRILQGLCDEGDQPPKQPILPIGAVFLEHIPYDRVVRERRKHIDQAWEEARKFSEEHGHHATPEEGLVCYYCIQDLAGRSEHPSPNPEATNVREQWKTWWWNYVCPTILEQTKWLKHAQDAHESERMWLQNRKAELENLLGSRSRQIRELQETIDGLHGELHRIRRSEEQKDIEMAELRKDREAAERGADLNLRLRAQEQEHTLRLEDIIKEGLEKQDRRQKRWEKKQETNIRRIAELEWETAELRKTENDHKETLRNSEKAIEDWAQKAEEYRRELLQQRR